MFRTLDRQGWEALSALKAAFGKASSRMREMGTPRPFTSPEDRLGVMLTLARAMRSGKRMLFSLQKKRKDLFSFFNVKKTLITA